MSFIPQIPAFQPVAQTPLSVALPPFVPESTAEEVIRDVKLNGKVVVVTGANSGIGKETTRVLAKAGATVILGCRNVNEGNKAVAEIAQEIPDAKERLEVLALDLSKFGSIRKFAGDFIAKHDTLNVLVLNAGIMVPPERVLHENGFESQFSTNHLGHFLLTQLLIEPLKKAGNSRVVAVSSSAHCFGLIELDDINFEKRPYQKWIAYGQSKVANILFAKELNRRLEQQGLMIRANSLHPGAILTNLQRDIPEDERELMMKTGLKWKSIPEGAATQVFLATAPEIEGIGGRYFDSCQLGLFLVPHADNAELAAQLWELSEKAVGEARI